MIKVMATPRTVDLELTSRCNLRCRDCYYMRNDGVSYDDMPTDRWLALLEELGQAKVMEVCLSGGEALLRPDVFELIEAQSGTGNSDGSSPANGPGSSFGSELNEYEGSVFRPERDARRWKNDSEPMGADDDRQRYAARRRQRGRAGTGTRFSNQPNKS